MKLLRGILITFAISVALTTAGGPGFAAPMPPTGHGTMISGVDVRLHLRAPLPDPIKDRIHNSLQKVGQKALEGKSVEEARSISLSLAQVMKKIFNEVLSGFRVIDLTIDLGARTSVDVYLEGRSPGIESVAIDVVLQEGIDMHWRDTFEKRTKNLSAELEDVLAGVPVESSRWSLGLVEQITSDHIDKSSLFPGMDVDISLQMAVETKVKLIIKPASTTIRMVSVKIRSATIPSLFLERIKYDLASRADLLIGLPVSFVNAEREHIIKNLEESITGSSFAGKLRLKYDIKASFQRRTVISLVAESERYSGFARVKVGLGKEDRNPDAEAHLGLFLIRDTEIFTEANFFPGPIDLHLNIGAGRRLGNFYAATGRNVIDGYNRIWLDYYVTEDIVLAWEKNVTEVKDEEIEGSLTFKAHDFFSLQVVTNFNKDIWLQFVFNL